MKKIQLKIELEFDDTVMYGDEPESKDWFYKDILGGKHLALFDGGDLGDEIGTVKVLEMTPNPQQEKL